MTRRKRMGMWLVAGLLLRLMLIYFPRTFDDDTTAYLELGRNLLHHGVYGMGDDTGVSPSVFRLPGYPIVLALGGGKFWLVEVVQSLLDLLGCWLLAATVRKRFGERAGEITLVLGTLCLFTAAYAATALTESLSIFAVAWGIYAFSEWQRRSTLKLLVSLAGAASLAMLLRPDGALLTFALLLAMAAEGLYTKRLQQTLREAAMMLAFACLPLSVWAVRNYVTFHIFQPLAPRHVNDPGERVNLGFYRWLRTWSVEFSTTGTVFWQVGTNPISMDYIPPSAYDSPAQRAETEQLIAAYNVKHDVDQPLDDRFARLAEQRIREHPLRYYVVVPVIRTADMLFRPRTEMFDLDTSFWRWEEHPWQSAAAVAMALINLAYFALALAGARRGRVPCAMLLGTYFMLRCCLLGTLENPEPRYSVELYPVLIMAAGSFFAARQRMGNDS